MLAPVHPALQPLAANTAELKRLFVLENWRVGWLLVERLLDEARHVGYARVRLDSLPTMTSATALYRSVGFMRCER